MAANKTKPSFTKAVAGWLEKNRVTTGRLQCLSSKDVVTVLQMGWWQSFRAAVVGCVCWFWLGRS